ncbi:hypothetical protein GCK72_008479 [Caenorhabditis remanei]|uniref:SXP/RAL-2 family protein Ani s 5-like cation-binding domain-containing protein n=1 Tax=Caenorhabditis remanei TaxID=31234 RepID=A0A6A5H0R7_CAERE|nr:hypothetical protein GCK72_008479 [Caenorhabditis remanei]KAF1760233.1 hypothetical protein GCK72_008479 [Caenorhabditis remanei]
MSSFLFISCLLLVCWLTAEIFIRSPTTSSSSVNEILKKPFDFDEQLSKINSTCLPLRELRELTADLVAGSTAERYNRKLLSFAQRSIGFREMRTVLGFPPIAQWTKYWNPSEEEVKAAPTVEKYYELREAINMDRRWDSQYFFEKQLQSGMDFLDKWVPAVRNIYRRKFEEIRGRPEAKLVLDREEIDYMFGEYKTIKLSVQKAIRKMFEIKEECRHVVGKKLKKNEEKENQNSKFDVNDV